MDDHELQKLAIERYVAGELDPEASGRVAAHCETCAACAGYLNKLCRAQDDFLTEHPYTQFKQRIAPAQSARHGFFVKWLRRPVLAPVFGVAAALLVLLPIAVHRVGVVGPGEEILFKGGSAHLSFLLKRDGKTSPGNPRDTFFVDDEIQILYSAQGRLYVSLVSVDSRGDISMYDPDTNAVTCGVAAQAGPNRPYPVSIRLDNSKGVEMVFALLSDRPLATDGVKRWISSALDDVLPDVNRLPGRLEATKGKLGVSVLTLVLHKG
jgi:hypothetical protein